MEGIKEGINEGPNEVINGKSVMCGKFDGIDEAAVRTNSGARDGSNV
jgi:hypothetical protein